MENMRQCVRLAGNMKDSSSIWDILLIKEHPNMKASSMKYAYQQQLEVNLREKFKLKRDQASNAFLSPIYNFNPAKHEWTIVLWCMDTG